MSKNVRVRFFATLRLALGVAFIDVELSKPTKIRELLRGVSSRLGVNIEEKLLENGRLRRGTMLLVNGKNVIHLDGLDTIVEEGEISVFPPAGGG